MRAFAALLLVLALPAATASTVELRFAPSFGTAALHAEGELVGAEAAQVRSAIDQFGGNRDGNVSADEVARFMMSGKGILGARIAAMLAAVNFTLDGVPASTEIGGVDLEGTAGPVQGGPPIAFSLNMTFLFPVEGNETHTLRLVGRPTAGGTTHTTIVLPPGWTVAEAQGVVAEGTSTGTVRFDVPIQGEQVALRFALAKSAPSFGFLAGLGALGLALVSVRSLRREPA